VANGDRFYRFMEGDRTLLPDSCLVKMMQKPRGCARWLMGMTQELQGFLYRFEQDIAAINLVSGMRDGVGRHQVF